MAEAPHIYRIPMRSAKPDVDHTAEIERAIELGICGVGWGVLEDPPRTLGETLERIEAFPSDRGWGSRAARCVERFAAAPRGSLMWSRHTDGTWLLGKLTGRWRGDYSIEAAVVDLHQVRTTKWAPHRLLTEEVPGAVIRAFSGRGSSFSEIHNQVSRLFSQGLYAELHGEEFELPRTSAEQVLRDLLEPFDVEDLVFAYLQAVRGYLVIPAARRTNNQTYEYVVVERGSEGLIPVSVKTGATPVDVGQLASTAEVGGRAIAYSTEGNYQGDGAERVERIADPDLLDFVAGHPDLLPPRVRRWFRYAAH